MRKSARVVAIVALVAGMHAVAGRASHPSLTECFEGSDFIGNAALAQRVRARQARARLAPQQDPPQLAPP